MFTDFDQFSGIVNSSFLLDLVHEGSLGRGGARAQTIVDGIHHGKEGPTSRRIFNVASYDYTRCFGFLCVNIRSCL